MKVKFLNPNAFLPKKGSDKSAGYDLASVEAGVIKSNERLLIKTGIVLEIPSGYYGRIAPRSGLAFKSGIDVMAGVIDSDYRGEVGVILYNSDKDNDFIFGVGDKIAASKRPGSIVKAVAAQQSSFLDLLRTTTQKEATKKVEETLKSKATSGDLFKSRQSRQEEEEEDELEYEDDDGDDEAEF